MANEPVKPKQIWFDIETTGIGAPSKGFHFLHSSVLEISFGGNKGIIKDLAASPNLGPKSQISHWSREKAWEPLLRRGVPILTEKEIIGKFIKQLEMNAGAELIGWNIGYKAEAPGLQQALRGYDVTGLMARATRYGLQDQMKAAFEGVKLRDIGQEFMVRVGQRMFEDPNRIERILKRKGLSPELYDSTRGYAKQIRISKSVYGARNVQDVARYMSTSGVRVAGWSQENTLRIFRWLEGQGDIELGDKLLAAELQDQWNEKIPKGHKNYLGSQQALDIIRGQAAHQAQFDVAVARLLTSKIDNFDSYIDDDNFESFVRYWAALTERQKALNTITFGGFTGDKIQDILEGSWFRNLPTEAELEKDRAEWKKNPANRGKIFPPDVNPTTVTKESFLKDVADAASTKYGGKGALPKGFSDWGAVIKDLKRGESLAYKHGLREAGLLTELFGAKAAKQAGQAADVLAQQTLKTVEATLGSPAKQVVRETGEAVGKAVSSLSGKGAMLTVAALTAGAAGPLHLLGTNADSYKEEIAGHWKHVLFAENPEVNRIPGTDHLYNTVRGLPHQGVAHFNRPLNVDFGSGWIPANGNALLLSDPDHTLEGNFEAMRRVQAAIADDKVNDEEYNSFLRALRYREDTRISSYYTEDMPYLDRALNYLLRAPAPGEPNEIFGVRIDDSVMDFRREVLQDREKHLDFKAQLANEQRAAQENLGRFKRSDLFDANLQEYSEMALQARGLRAVNLNDFKLEVEDADTLLLRRKGLFSMFDDPISVRLSGIDAPETGGHKESGLLASLRINQEQPYGREAAQQLVSLLENSENHQLLVSSEPQTYGRYTGVIFGELGERDWSDINSWGDSGLGEQVNLNMELLRRGAVAALPFGSSQSDLISRVAAAEAETQAAEAELGMWQYSRYKATRKMTELLRNPITFNTFTTKHKLANNLDLAAYASYLESTGDTKRNLTRGDIQLLKNMSGSLRRHGYSGSRRPNYMKGYNKSGRTFGSFAPPPAVDYGDKQIFQRKIPYTRPWASGDDDFYNTIEAFRHEGQAYRGRRRTDFGSGWDGYKSARKSHPMEDSPNVGATASPSVPSKPDAARSKENIVRGHTEKYKSMRNTHTRKGISTTISQLQSQVQGKNSSPGDLALESKKFSWDSDPSRGSKTQTKVDNFQIPNSIKGVDYVDKNKAIANNLAANKRKVKFYNGHRDAVIRRSVHAFDSGKRSKKGSGVGRIII